MLSYWDSYWSFKNRTGFEIWTWQSCITEKSIIKHQLEDFCSNSYISIICFIKSPKQRLETYCFCSVSYYYYSIFPCTMNLSTADLRNYRTEFHETWWSYRYMLLVDPKVFRFVVKGVKAIFLGVQRGWGLL